MEQGFELTSTHSLKQWAFGLPCEALIGTRLSIEDDFDLGRDVPNVGSSISNEIKQVEMCFCLVLGTWFLSLSDSICGQDWAL